jgi:uncharacterized protein YacL
MTDKLLPNYYKNIGLTLAAISIVLLMTNIAYQQLNDLNQESIDWILKDIFLISLLMIAFAKEKIENEKIIELRYNKLKQSVIFGGFVLIMDSLLQIIANYEVFEMKEGFLIMTMILLFYIITFNFRKYNFD